MAPATPDAPAGTPAFHAACALLREVLEGGTRRQVLETLATSREFGKVLLQLRRQMRSHVLRAGERDIDLSGVVLACDRRTREEDGLNVLNDWDGILEVFNEDIIPVDVLKYLIRKRGGEETDRAALATLLDYYLFYVLVLLSMRVWDDGDPNENLSALQSLLDRLQGPEGSGHFFVGDAPTLYIIAISSYEPEEWAYPRLLERLRTLDASHRTTLAIATATTMGCHLRFGFRATYGLDMGLMRADNSVDYAWLSWALVNLMQDYERLRGSGEGGREREEVVEALLNGLSCDAGAYFAERPAMMIPFEAERSELRARFERDGERLKEEWQRFRPREESYSPLSFRFNFPHNVLKGAVADALLWGEPWPVTLNDLLTELPVDEREGRTREGLARTLMRQARAAPAPIRGRLMPVIVYDVRDGQAAFEETLDILARSGASDEASPEGVS